MEREKLATNVRDLVRREWWIVAVVVAVALCAAALAGGTPKTSYQAQATFLADLSISGSYKGIPTPDDVVRDVGTARTRASIAASLGLPASRLSTLQYAGFGNPQNRLLVTFTSPDKAHAAAVIRAADQAVLDYVQSRTDVERLNLEKQIRDADAAEASMAAALDAKSVDAYQRADIQFKIWQVGQSRAVVKNSVDMISTVYHLQSEPSVSTTPATSSLVSRLVMAALAGIVVGLLLAGVRETLRRGRTAPRS